MDPHEKLAREIVRPDAVAEAVERSARYAPDDFGQEAYASLADELSVNARFIEDDADPQWVEAAKAFSFSHGLPWPPPSSEARDAGYPDSRESYGEGD